MVKVDVKPTMLQWAIRRSGRLETDFQRRFPKLDKWLDGSDSPTLKQLEDFALFTRTPLGYLFLSTPPKEVFPIPYYRTMDPHSEYSEISPNLRETVQILRSRQSWMREYMIERGIEPLKFVNSCGVNDSILEIAKRIRDTLGLATNWASYQPTWTEALKYFRNKIEDSGILVIVNGIVGNNTHRKLDPQEFRGFVLVDEYAPFLFINGSDSKAAQMFTLVHELAHVFLGHSAAFDLRGSLPSDNDVEKKCDQVAAEFLVPATEFVVEWEKEKGNNNVFQNLARTFKVSEIVVARRALDLAFIDKTRFFNFYEGYMNQEHKIREDQSGGGDFYVNQRYRIGRRFAESVIMATKEGSLLYSEAYQLTGLRGKTFDEFAHSIGREV